MNYLLRTRKGDHLVPLQSPEELWAHAEFNRELDTAILVTGWFSNIDSTMENDALEAVWEAYKCRGNINFIVSFIANFCQIKMLNVNRTLTLFNIGIGS